MGMHVKRHGWRYSALFGLTSRLQVNNLSDEPLRMHRDNDRTASAATMSTAAVISST